ncbi:Na+/H+ antiporter NhaC family protein [Effusibacillus pohliae]|uniref:Na+/H+ antiporter NhaC family protein n=1 Tax=Effusibacillus pohliae TaxID=232270 RepID=UPI00039D453F|nr:Na+/H+ antiporter NhaC family protein [Effusibacillus pohliae]
MEPGRAHRISLGLSALPFVVAVSSLFAALFLFQLPIYCALLAGWLTALVIANRHGFSLRSLLAASYRGMTSTSIVVIILLLIGGLIAVWMASGTVAGLIVYGIQLVVPQYLVVTAFLLAFMMSMLLGTSVGTLSTMGIALASMAQAIGIPSGLIGGALISGAMVGDRTSPLSGTLHLLAATVGMKSDETFRSIVRSGTPVFFICLLLYAWLGYQAVDPHTSVQGGAEAVRKLSSVFQLPWWVLIPPALVMLLVACRVPIRINLALGIVLGAVLACTVQGRSLQEIASIAWNGFSIKAPDGSVLLEGGGVWHMMHVVSIILTAGALNGILEMSGMMDRLIGGVLEPIKRQGSLLVATGLISIAAGLIFCNQTLMVLIPGRMLQAKYRELGEPPVRLATALADSGVVAAVLIPWNLHSILCATAIGIAATTYWPYAFFVWMLPLLTIAKGALRLTSREETD